MEQVFISFRSDDTAEEAHELQQLINQEFGADTAYMFKVANDPGEDFAERLRVAVSRAKVVITLIGPRWLHTQSGRDWVLAELEDALDAGIPLIPILVRGVSLPSDVASPRLQQYLQRAHYLKWDELITADTQRFFESLTRRYRVRKRALRWSALGSSMLPSLTRITDPRRLILHGPQTTSLRLTEAFFLLLLAGYGVFFFMDYLDYTEIEIHLETITPRVLLQFPIAVVCFLPVAFPFLLLRREHLVDAFIATVATMAVNLVVLSPPSLLLQFQLNTDYQLDIWTTQLIAASDNSTAVADLIERFPDYVENAFFKVIVVCVVALLCYTVFGWWVYKMARVLRILLRMRYSSIYFFAVLFVAPIMGILVPVLYWMPGVTQLMGLNSDA